MLKAPLISLHAILIAFPHANFLSLNDRSDEEEREDIFQKHLNEEEGCDDDDDGDFDVNGETGHIEGRWEEDDEVEMRMTSEGRDHDDHDPPVKDGLIQNNQNIQNFNNFHDQNNSHSRNQIRVGLSANPSSSSVVPFNNFSGGNHGNGSNGKSPSLSGHQTSQYLQRKSKQKIEFMTRN